MKHPGNFQSARFLGLLFFDLNLSYPRPSTKHYQGLISPGWTRTAGLDELPYNPARFSGRKAVFFFFSFHSPLRRRQRFAAGWPFSVVSAFICAVAAIFNKSGSMQAHYQLTSKVWILQYKLRRTLRGGPRRRNLSLPTVSHSRGHCDLAEGEDVASTARLTEKARSVRKTERR